MREPVWILPPAGFCVLQFHLPVSRSLSGTDAIFPLWLGLFPRKHGRTRRTQRLDRRFPYAVLLLRSTRIAHPCRTVITDPDTYMEKHRAQDLCRIPIDIFAVCGNVPFHVRRKRTCDCRHISDRSTFALDCPYENTQDRPPLDPHSRAYAGDVHADRRHVHTPADSSDHQIII